MVFEGYTVFVRRPSICIPKRDITCAVREGVGVTRRT